MLEFSLLDYENVPCWFELSFDQQEKAIIVRIHDEFLGKIKAKEKQLWPYSENLKKDFDFSSFQGEFIPGNFGFDGALQCAGQKNDFWELKAYIPILEQYRMKTCLYCQGNKRDMLFGGVCETCQGSGVVINMIICDSCHGEKLSYGGDECFRCKGKGKIPDLWMDWKTFQRIALSFSVVFNLLRTGEMKDYQTSSEKPQLLLVETAVLAGNPYGAPITGKYSPKLIEWIKTQQEGNIKEVSGAMQTCWKQIHREANEIDLGYIWTDTRKTGWIYISCPGDRTGIHPALSHSIIHDQGYTFIDHNVDTTAQQLTLLAALGALSDKARREI
jgi:hypothetical protein